MSTELPPTEVVSARSAGLDLLSTPQLIELLIAEQRDAVDAALACAGAIGEAVDEIAARALLSGANVLGVRKENIPGGASLAAILRFPV